MSSAAQHETLWTKSLSSIYASRRLLADYCSTSWPLCSLWLTPVLSCQYRRLLFHYIQRSVYNYTLIYHMEQMQDEVWAIVCLCLCQCHHCFPLSCLCSSVLSWFLFHRLSVVGILYHFCDWFLWPSACEMMYCMRYEHGGAMSERQQQCESMLPSCGVLDSQDIKKRKRKRTKPIVSHFLIWIVSVPFLC